MRSRIPSQPIIDHRDSTQLPDSDREWCAQLLRDHEQRFHSGGSIPVRISTKWFKYSGGWKAAVAILAIVGAVIITYLRTK